MLTNISLKGRPQVTIEMEFLPQFYNTINVIPITSSLKNNDLKLSHSTHLGIFTRTYKISV